MPGMRPDDVYRLSGAADPRVSPDGTRVAYLIWWIDERSKEYASAIWVAAVDGSSAPRRLTNGPKRDADPRWSPDGAFLAFTSTREHDGAQLYVLPVDGPGEALRLTNLKEPVKTPAWSPDGDRIAFAARLRDEAYDEEDDAKRLPRRFTRLQFRLDDEGWTGDRPSHLFVVPADGSSEPIQLTSGDFEDVSPSWSQDGTRIAFVSARHDDWDVTPISDIYVVGAAGGPPERLTATDGFCAGPSWSRDGTRIAYQYTPGIFDEPRHGQIAVLDLGSRARTVLTEALDRNCSPYPPIREPIWDREDLLFTVEDRGGVAIYRVPADASGKPEAITGDDRAVTGLDLAAGTLVHAAATATGLTEVSIEDRAITDVGRGFAEAIEIEAPERFSATSPDGAEVDAWILRPMGFEEGSRYPAVLNIHGGPFAQYGERFFDEFQVQAAAGYVVVFANPRGSSGYDEAWGRATRGPVEGGPGWGSVDFDDLIAVVDAALERFAFIDPERLGVMGGSYGGYMTSWIVGHTDRFRCAISERAVNDLASEDGTSDLAGFFRGYVGAYPWEAPELYRQISPLTYAEDITTPLLILHSENDLRCSIGQAEQLFTMLRILKREVELVRFPAESHELTRSGSPTHRVQRFEIVLDWLDRHLKG